MRRTFAQSLKKWRFLFVILALVFLPAFVFGAQLIRSGHSLKKQSGLNVIGMYKKSADIKSDEPSVICVNAEQIDAMSPASANGVADIRNYAEYVILPAVAPAGTTLVTKSGSPANSVIDPVQTVSFCLQKTRAANTCASVGGPLSGTGGVITSGAPQTLTGLSVNKKISRYIPGYFFYCILALS